MRHKKPLWQFFVIVMLLTGFAMPVHSVVMNKKGSQGYTLLCSTSMFPLFSCENNLTMKFVGYSHNFTLGDVVAYSPTITQRYILKLNGFPSSSFIIHRIVMIDSKNFFLKGDNNPYYDNNFIGNISEYQILYKLIGIK